MKVAGTLVKWNDERGFGFVRTAAGDEVFVHASAFPPDPRRPELGEALLFDIYTAPDGRLRASDVQRPGRTVRRRGTTRALSGQRQGRSVLANIFLFLFLVALGAYGWQKFRHYTSPAPTTFQPEARPGTAAPAALAAPLPEFRCDGRTRCRQMTSCAEARFFLANCPGVQMDGDKNGAGPGDGDPCEQQWCN